MTLRGLCWDHERCVAPMRAAAGSWSARGGAAIAWDARPLAAFNDQPLEEIADRYDLMFIDHPFVGTAAATGLLAPLDELIGADDLTALAAGAIGPSHASYVYAGHVWALATDAACQVAVVRDDLLAEPVPTTWAAVLELARRRPGAVALPLYHSDALCSVLTLQAAAGRPFDPATGFDERALAYLLDLLPHLHPLSPGSNPPTLLDAMRDGDEIAYMPLAFGYSAYAPRLRFTDIPGVRGSILGGAGLAISASGNRGAAAAFAAWASGAEAQREIVAPAGGQPGHRAAWDDAAVDAAAGGFYSGTRATIDASWVRPRAPWWPPFARDAGELLAAELAGAPEPARLAAALDELIPDLQEVSS